MWYIGESGLTNDQFLPLPADYLVKPYPLTVWRIEEGKNDGFPFIPLWLEPAPPPIAPVKQNPYICVYDMYTDKQDFAGNGIAVLTPTECRSAHQLNGEYSLRLTHPMDGDGRWQCLREYNYIKAGGQIYTVKTVTRRQNGTQNGTVEVYAEHISYQLGDPWLFPFPYPIARKSCQTILNAAMYLLYYHAEPGQHSYAFDVVSDMVFDTDFVFANEDGRTFLDLLMGAGGIIETKGGELYRDNFYLSLNQTMEGAKSDAFDIRLGRNLSGISVTVDLTTFCSYFRAYDNYGSWIAVAWRPNSFILRNFPHHVIRSKNFSYDEPDFDRLDQDCMAEFRRNGSPVIVYEIDLAQARRDPDFAELNPDFDYRVGNTGRVIDPVMGAVTLKITGIVRDEITGDVVSITIGNRQSFTRGAGYPAIAIAEPEVQGGEIALTDADGEILFDADGEQMTEVFV